MIAFANIRERSKVTINIDIESTTYGFLFTSFPKFCNELIRICAKHFLCCNLFIVYIKLSALL